MVEYIKGTVFNSGAQTLVNTVNLDGVMGAGIALEFALRYPEMLERYKVQCKNKEIRIGRPRIYEVFSDNLILNFPTKDKWIKPSKIEYIQKGLEYFVNNYKRSPIKSIAFPKLGTSKGGLDWKEVNKMMEYYLNDIKDIDIYICLDELPYAEGREKLMVDSLNSYLFEYRENEKNQKIKISTKVLEELRVQQPFVRFWEISNVSGIGRKSYANLFNYFYEKTSDTNDKTISIQTFGEQMTLF